MSIDLSSLTIAKAHESMARGELSVRDLVDAYLERIAEKNDELNIYRNICTDIDAQVEHAQAMYANGTAQVLTGIPVAVKANIQIKGQICNASSRMLEHYVAVYDATAIRRLREAGVIFLGATNMDEFAMGSSTENSAFGVTKNPHDTQRVPGGSSGGSAAAVAADMALAALGTDTGGSIRQPASFCGITGFKGTYGSVSRYGAAAMGSSLDQIGPLAKTVEDARLLWRGMRGHDEQDMTSLGDAVWPSSSTQKKYRIALPTNCTQGTEDSVHRAYESAVEKLRGDGHTVDEVDIPSLGWALPVYYVVMPAEVSSNLARYDGIRYGFQAENTNGLHQEYVQSRSQGFGSEVKRRIILGTYVLSAGYADQYYTRALALREKMKAELAELFTRYDAILTPTSPVPPFPIGEKSDNPMEMYLADIYTVGANIAGIPGVSVPAGMNDDGLPIGIQFLAAHAHDEQLLDLAQKFEMLG